MADFDAKKEKMKLKRIIKNIPDDKKKLVAGLIADASFQAEQLEALREDIAENGWSEEYCNGPNQYGKKTRIEGETYIKLQKSYQSIIRQLTELLPDNKGDVTLQAGEALAAFISQGTCS